MIGHIEETVMEARRDARAGRRRSWKDLKPGAEQQHYMRAWRRERAAMEASANAVLEPAARRDE